MVFSFSTDFLLFSIFFRKHYSVVSTSDIVGKQCVNVVIFAFFRKFSRNGFQCVEKNILTNQSQY